ncbi:MAG: MFS transporter [Thermodesulfobacteriota bacterium]
MATLHRHIIFSVCALLFLMSQFYRVSVGIISPRLMEDLGIDPEGLSLMSAVFFYAFALTQIPLAIFLDKIGSRKIMGGLNLIGVSGAVMFAFSDSLLMLTLSRLMLGVGMSCNLMGTFKLISRWFEPSRFATLTTLMVSLGTAGALGATTPLALLVEALSWRSSFLIVAGSNLLLTVLFFTMVRDSPAGTDFQRLDAEAGGSFKEMISGLRELFLQKDYWIISLATLCRYGIVAAIQTLYAGLYLIKGKGLSPVSAGNILFLMNIGMIMGGPVFGVVSDRILKSRKQVVIAGLLGMSVILMTMAVGSEHYTSGPLFFIFFLLGVFSSAGMVMFTHIKERMPPERAGASMTGINLFNMIGPAVFLQGLGVFIQRGNGNAVFGPDAFKNLFFVCAGTLGLVAILYSMTTDSKKIR